MQPEKEIVIVGGGYAGVHVAQKLDRLVGGKDAKITLINDGPSHVLLTDLHEVAGNRIRPEAVEIPLERVFSGTSVRVVNDSIIKIDPENHVLSSARAEYHYDYAILACGSEPAYYGIPGMQENAFTLWSLEDALEIKRQVSEMFRQARSEPDAVKRQELLTFVVGGGGFTGVEMVGELVEWLPDLCREHEISPHEVHVILVEALPTILPNLRPSLRERAMAFMKRKGVTVLTNSPITEVSEDHITLKSGTILKTRTLIWTGGVQTKSNVKELGFSCGHRGRILVNECMQTEKYPDVYAIGDNALFVNENGELPALVEAGLQGADFVAKAIASAIHGKPQGKFKPKLHGVMVSIGSHYAVADIGGVPLWGFPAMAMKHLVNLHYLFGVGKLWLTVRYLREEFLNERGGLSGLYRHLNVKTSMFWLVILRLFLGYQWLASGIEKVQAGFLVSGDKLVSGSSLVPMGPGTPAWYSAFMEKVVFPHALLFQRMITLGELALGIAFIFGLFTVLAALGSIFMNINFMLSGTGNIWFLVASIPMLGGAGRAFGLDYYVIPYLQALLCRSRRGSASEVRKAADV
ncbi:MAG TPA: FAD-dependent oxidoreductase [Firmicutes bacterium]|nr:FAD-dependent oxidoreductase [Bacillota bacterium]